MPTHLLWRVQFFNGSDTAMSLIYNNDDAKEAAIELRSLGASALKVLREVVEHQEVRRTRLTDAARKLDSAGFIRISSYDTFTDDEFVLHSCLAGEEALEALDEISC